MSKKQRTSSPDTTTSTTTGEEKLPKHRFDTPQIFIASINTDDDYEIKTMIPTRDVLQVRYSITDSGVMDLLCTIAQKVSPNCGLSTIAIQTLITLLSYRFEDRTTKKFEETIQDRSITNKIGTTLLTLFNNKGAGFIADDIPEVIGGVDTFIIYMKGAAAGVLEHKYLFLFYAQYFISNYKHIMSLRVQVLKKGIYETRFAADTIIITNFRHVRIALRNLIVSHISASFAGFITTIISEAIEEQGNDEGLISVMLELLKVVLQLSSNNKAYEIESVFKAVCDKPQHVRERILMETGHREDFIKYGLCNSLIYSTLENASKPIFCYYYVAEKENMASHYELLWFLLKKSGQKKSSLRKLEIDMRKRLETNGILIEQCGLLSYFIANY